MEYADIVLAGLGVLGLAWAADQLTGRRGYGVALLVSATGAACGWFLSVRVFALAVPGDWLWPVWSFAGAALCLVAFYLLRSKR